MTELLIYRGLPGSGKTTSAQRWVLGDAKNRARVNRDSLRAMLHGGYVDGPTEYRAVSTARDALIEALLRKGISVASDDTNLPPKVAKQLAFIGRRAGAEIRVVDCTDVSLALCIARDLDREHSVGEDVIRGMHTRYLAGKSYPLPPIPDTEPDILRGDGIYVPDDTLPPAWIVDLDGTLALMNDRSPFDWHRVGEDTVNEPVREIAVALTQPLTSRFPRLVIVSGRDACCRTETEEWLDRHEIAYHDLLMRPAGDMRKDAIVKLELFREKIAPRYAVRGVLDDRDQVVEMWRSLGLPCLQVAPGAF